MKNIEKRFPGVIALKDVNLGIIEGEVHALCGENGAGKSTLMKILSGAQSYSSGEMFINDQQVKFNSTKDAEEKGISMIYQEFNLLSDLTVAENIFLGRLPMKGFLVDWKKLHQDTQDILDRLKLNISSKTKVSELSVGECQMTEIAKSLTLGANIIIMDEPTATLTDRETQTLFAIIANLKANNVAVIYISHRMDEIFEITERITILRNGKFIETLKTCETNYDEVVSLMIGRDISELYPLRAEPGSEVIFEIENFNGQGVKNASFELKRGEILGIVGLLGSGNIELSKMIYGATERESGTVRLNGVEINTKTPYHAIAAGIGLVPDDRKQEGLVLVRNITENISLSSLKKISNYSFLNKKIEKKIVTQEIADLNIKVYNPNEQITSNLSGGNQQKVLFAKVLETNPTVCILDEPTRGVDVGARVEIYGIIDELTKQGKSVVLVSSDLQEILGMSDRILVMKEGEIILEKMKKETNQEEVLAYASGAVK